MCADKLFLLLLLERDDGAANTRDMPTHMHRKPPRMRK